MVGLASRQGEVRGRRWIRRVGAGTRRVVHPDVPRELPRTREPTTEELRDMLGYGGPKFDPMPELLGFIAHVLLVGVTLWALGWWF